MSTFSSMQTGNPVLGGNVFADWARADRRGTTMTVAGTAGKALVLLAIALLTAGFAWDYTDEHGASMPILLGGCVGGLIFAFATVFKPTWAPITGPLYAACEGLVLGAVSVAFETRYQGIVFNAIAVTLGVTLLMFTLYATRIVRVTGPLATGIMAATGAGRWTSSTVGGFFNVSMAPHGLSAIFAADGNSMPSPVRKEMSSSGATTIPKSRWWRMMGPGCSLRGHRRHSNARRLRHQRIEPVMTNRRPKMPAIPVTHSPVSPARR